MENPQALVAVGHPDPATPINPPTPIQPAPTPALVPNPAAQVEDGNNATRLTKSAVPDPAAQSEDGDKATKLFKKAAPNANGVPPQCQCENDCQMCCQACQCKRGSSNVGCSCCQCIQDGVKPVTCPTGVCCKCCSYCSCK